MRKGMKITIVVALLCILSGIVVCCGALAAIGSDFSLLNTMKFETNAYEITDSFANIRVDAAEGDIRLLPTQDGTCKVVCSESDKISHTVTVKDNTLTIIRTDTRKWYERIGIYFGGDREMALTVYVPEQEYENLKLTTVSGGISVPAAFTFTQAELHSTSGDIVFGARSVGTLKAETTSGDIQLSAATADSISVSSVSGEIEASDITAASLSAASTSGEVELKSVVVTNELSAETVSGEIELEGCDAQTLRLKSVSGNIFGTLLTGKQFTTHTTSGNVNVPASTAQGKCDITTTSGNIRIKLVP